MIKRYFKARSDDEFFEQTSRIVFIAGFRYSLVEKKWPAIRRAFHNFSIRRVARFKERDIKRLMSAEGIIRNEQKIRAVVENALICSYIQEGHGSVLRWIAYLKKEQKRDSSLRISDELMRFKRIGRETSQWLGWLYESKRPYVQVRVPDA